MLWEGDAGGSGEAADRKGQARTCANGRFAKNRSGHGLFLIVGNSQTRL
jgi:hypothetical protein